MRKAASKKHHVNTSKQNLLKKPYGFCCDIKDDDSRLQLQQKVFIPPFLSSGTANEGPDIRFRVHEEDASSPTRGTQRGGKNQSGQRGKQRGAAKTRGGNVNKTDRRGGNSTFDGQRDGNSIFDERRSGGGDRMICHQCRGPMKWYLEDEIAAARHHMITKRIDKSNTDWENNIKAAKKKEKKKRRKHRKKSSNEAKEETQETEEKT